MHPSDPAPVGTPRAPASELLADLEFVRRFGRQLILPEVGLTGQRRLAASKVLVVGLGGLGASVALQLAAMGVGELHLMDPDRVELSNLHRQVLYTTADLGRPKTEAAARRLAERAPGVRLRADPVAFETGDAVARAAGVDVVVDASDNFPTRYRVNDACVRAGRPEVFAAVHRLEGQLAVFDARVGPCYRCLFPEPPPADLTPACGEAGVLGALPGLLGTLQAVEAVRLLEGWAPAASGRLLLVDLKEGEFRALQLRRREGCDGCRPGVEGTPMPPDPPTEPPHDAGFTFLSPQGLKAELGRGDPPTLVDLRSAEERSLGQLPDAVWVPFDQLPERVAELAAAVRPVLFCQWGGRSERAARWIAEAGLRQVRVLRGGLDAYASEVDPSVLSV